MLTNPVYRSELSWTQTRENLAQVCNDLDLEWYYDPTSYRIVFKHKGIENTMLHNLEVCFGDTANLQFVATKELLMRMGYDGIRDMLGWWMEGRSVL